MLKKKQSFNDGLLEIFHTDDDGNPEEMPYVSKRYQNRVIGVKRHYAAMTADSKISKLVRVSGIVEPHETDIVQIEQKSYQIVQTQYIHDTIAVTDLTLKAYGRW